MAKVKQKEKKQKAVKQVKPRKKTVFSSLITKTVFAFAILILIIVVQGVTSYTTAKNMLMTEAEDSRMSCICLRNSEVRTSMASIGAVSLNLW